MDIDVLMALSQFLIVSNLGRLSGSEWAVIHTDKKIVLTLLWNKFIW